MKFAQSWQDFIRMPEHKALKESKGIHACKQKYIQEQNKMQWHYPNLINETTSPGQSTNNSIAADGTGTPFILILRHMMVMLILQQVIQIQ